MLLDTFFPFKQVIKTSQSSLSGRFFGKLTKETSSMLKGLDRANETKAEEGDWRKCNKK